MSNLRQLPPELEVQVLSFLNEKCKDSEPELFESMTHYPKQDLFFLAQFFLAWKRFDFMEALFEFEPNIANFFQDDDPISRPGLIQNEGLLCQAIVEEDVAAVQWLLEHGARIDFNYGESCDNIWAFLSLKENLNTLADLLFKHGAGYLLIEKNKGNYSAFDTLLFSLNYTPLTQKEEQIQNFFIPFLEKCTSYLEPSLFINHLLLRAAEIKSLSIVRWCLQKGASILTTDEDGNCIFHYWVDGLDEDQDILKNQDKSLYLELFTVLMEQGADLSYQNPHTGNNALHSAVLFNNAVACQTLLEAEIPIVLNQQGYHPLEIAQNHQRFNMIPWIEKAILQQKVMHSNSPTFLKPRI